MRKRADARHTFGYLTMAWALIGFLTVALPTHAADFYLDAVGGNDGNTGLSTGAAWKTLAKVNARTFTAGDRLLIKAGTVYNGQLWPKGSGTASNPIIIDAYGAGAKPRIDGQGTVADAVKLYNQQGWEIWNLEIRNTGATRTARTGVLVELENFGLARHIHLRNLYIHDVNGSSGGRSAGIYIANGGTTVESRFDDLRVEGCHLKTVGGKGIFVLALVESYYRREYPRVYNTGLIVRNNLLEDIWRDGILVIGCQGALVEHNTLKGGNSSQETGSAGMWCWSADDTVFQFNEVSGMRGLLDGQAFDSDFNTRNTVIQYNYSHDNHGGFVSMFAKGASENPQNIDTVVRYNISQNDGHNTVPTNPHVTRRGELLYIAGPMDNPKIYNNVFYVHASKQIVMEASDWGGLPRNLQFYNNIFYIANGGELKNWISPTLQGLVWNNNGFYAVAGQAAGFPDGLPNDPFKLTSDPRFVSPGSGGTGLTSVAGYQLQSNSPYRPNAGKVMANNGGRDFWGFGIPVGANPGIGAHYFPTGGAETTTSTTTTTLAVTTTTTTTTSSTSSTAGPVTVLAHWPAEDTSGVLTDVSGGGRHAAAVGTPTYAVPGAVDLAVWLDDTASYFNAGTDAAFRLGQAGASFTLSGWFKTDSGSRPNVWLMNKEGTGFGNRSYGVWLTEDAFNAGAVTFRSGGGDLPNVYSAQTGLWDGTWHHFAAVFDNANDLAKVYVDGALSASETWTTDSLYNDPATSLIIGARRASSPAVQPVALDDLRIYTHALDDNQIAALYALGTLPLTGYAAWAETHFVDPEAPHAAPGDDWDQDGSDNWSEYIAGTDPTDPKSRLEFQAVGGVDGSPGFVLQWSSVTGRLYTVWQLEALTHTNRHAIAGPLPASPPVNVHTVNVDGVVHGIYRIGVVAE